MVASAIGAPRENPSECVSFERESPEIKLASWGGSRSGAGRKRRQPVDLPDGPGGSGRRWYCLVTEPRAEYDVFGAAASLGFRCHLPRFVDRARRAKLHAHLPVIALLIPGFVLVEFDKAVPTWRLLPTRPGAKRLLGSTPEEPTPARIGEVERLIALGRAGDGVIDDQATPFPTGRARPGQSVRIEEGALTSFPGICTWSDARRLRILAAIFGRNVEIELRHDQVTVV